MATIGTFKGSPIINLNPESKYPFSFGRAKALLILENLEAIRAFVGEPSRQQAAPVSAPDRFDMAYEDDCARRTGN